MGDLDQQIPLTRPVTPAMRRRAGLACVKHGRDASEVDMFLRQLGLKAESNGGV